MPNARWAGVDRAASLPPDWPEISEAVLERDQHRCRIGFPGCPVRAAEVAPIHDREEPRPEILRGTCHRCHIKRSAIQGGVAVQRDMAAMARAAQILRPVIVAIVDVV